MSTRPRFGGLWWIALCFWGGSAAETSPPPAVVPVAESIRGSNSAPLADLFVETWTTRDGLPHNLVLDLAQTPDGYLWLATWEGVVRFNGLEFVVLDRSNLADLSDNGIRALHVGPSGSLWVATARGGVVRRQANEWSFINQEIGLTDAQIMSVIESKDSTLWVLTEDAGLERRKAGGDRRRFTAEDGLPSNVAYGMVQDRLGRILVATGEGLGVVEGNDVRGLSVRSGLPRGPVLSVRVGPAGEVYAGTEQGVYRASEKLDFSLVHPGLAKEAAQTLFVDVDGTLWIGTIANGIYRFSSGTLDHLGVAEGLPNGRVAAILRDDEQSLWVSTNAGLMRLREAPIRSYGLSVGLADDYVRTVIEDRSGTTWVGTSNGLTRWRDGQFKTLNGSSGLPGNSILSLGLASDGGLWVGTYYNGLVKLKNDRVVAAYSEADGLPSNSVRAIAEAAGGVIWVGTSRGLARIDAAGVRIFGLAEGLPRELVISMHRDRAGRVWVGTTKGMAVIESDRLRAIDLSPYGGAHRVFGFAEEADGTLWLATDRGLLRHRADAKGRDEFGHIGASHGLPYDSLFAVIVDDLGGLWASSNRGLLRVDLAQAHRAADGKLARIDVERFGDSDGMASPQANGGSSPSAVRRDDGTLWFSTAKGVASVTPARQSAAVLEAPKVIIEKIRVDDEQPAVADVLTLPAGARRVELSFAGLTFLQAKRLRYRYRLEGFDSEWVDGSSSRTAQFTNLPPGEYRFRVTAARPNGEWSKDEARLRLVVTPQFWQRSGFLPMLALIGLMLTYALYRWRIGQLNANARRLTRLVDERTSELLGHTERLLAADEEKSVLLAELKRQSDAFAQQAREDGLTGLANRRAFDEALAREFARAQRSNRPLCLALLDVDHFKRVNDAFSHAAGDAILKAMSAIMQKHSREVDLVARWGGEEFALLFPDTSLRDAITICERLRAGIAEFDASEIAPGLRVTVSIGIAAHTGFTHHERMLIRADERLYAAKQAGRNLVLG
ncbi:MAG: ligand-binding sensor domain-containing protein [Pseudomarimonas sp.]